MINKAVQFKIKGMLRDLTESAFNPEYAFENLNIRVTARDNNTLLSITNERGPKKIILKDTEGNNTVIKGISIGLTVLNNSLILFTHLNVLESSELPDYIYKIDVDNNSAIVKEVYKGHLNFSTLYPIEAMPFYENENIQKIYWVDGLNQMRVINVVGDSTNWNDESFNFVLTIALNELVSVEKSYTFGVFPSGVIQYAFTYYNKYGQESNIFNTTSLNYINYSNRGGSPEDKINNSFLIKLSSLDTRFLYVRIYSIMRTSLDAVPTVKLVIDLPITGDSLQYLDTGTSGSIVDPTILLYVGGEDIVPYTFTHKDNTLFLGNLKLNRKLVGDIEVEGLKLKDIFRNSGTSDTSRIQLSFVPDIISPNPTNPYLDRGINKKSRPVNEILNPIPSNAGFSYVYNPGYLLLNESKEVKRFKAREWYRVGIKFQHKTGKWSEVIWITDIYNDNSILSYATYFITHYPRIVIRDLNVIKALKDNDYIRALGVVCFPTLYDREVVALGILCPSLKHLLSDRDGTLEYQSSWFSRPLLPKAGSSGSIAVNDFEYTKLANSGYGEVQGYTPNMEGIAPLYEFVVNHVLATMHTPEIECSTDLHNFDFSSTKLRIVGNSVITANKTGQSLTLETPKIAPELSDYEFYSYADSMSIKHPTSIVGGSYLSVNPYWYDRHYAGTGSPAYFPVFPWLAYRSLTNWDGRPNHVELSPNKPSLLGKKKMFNLRFCGSNHYLDDPFTIPDTLDSEGGTIKGISPPVVFNSKESEVVTLNIKTRFGESVLSYSGNVDRVLTFGTENIKKDGYTIFETKSDGTYTPTGVEATDPISIKYKSSPHIAIYIPNKLPTINGFNSSSSRDNVNCPMTIPLKGSEGAWSTETSSCFWLGELYKEVDINTRFGGLSELALLNNMWINSGDVSLLEEGSISYVHLYEGDTFLQRFDSLRTYPFTLEDLNSIVDIVSFMVESRVNLDARYDRNRLSINHLVSSPTNYNLFNHVYDLSNNFFNYRVADYFNSSDEFPNMISWTKTKTEGEDIDTWTNITLSNTLSLDGDKGEVRSLKTLNNDIYSFQDRGISNIMFNSRTLISASDGVPIEIANSGKVDGKRYLSDKIGTTNKWSIVHTPNGLYFMDTLNKAIYLFNGSMDNMSDRLGFHSWIIENLNNIEPWNPEDFNNFISYYDSKHKDVYFTNNLISLSYSEIMGLFISFYNYEGIPAMFNTKDRFFSLRKEDNNTTLWALNEGEYNNFFGSFKPFYSTIVVNPEMPNDKVFNNLEFRADRFDENGNLILNKTMDNLKVWNEYLTGEISLNNVIGRPANLKEKFRVWRANMPRANGSPLLRIRNPWIYLRLGLLNENYDRTVLHDMIVHYSI